MFVPDVQNLSERKSKVEQVNLICVISPIFSVVLAVEKTFAIACSNVIVMQYNY